MKIKYAILSFISGAAFLAAIQSVSTVSYKLLYQPPFPEELKKYQK